MIEAKEAAEKFEKHEAEKKKDDKHKYHGKGDPKHRRHAEKDSLKKAKHDIEKGDRGRSRSGSGSGSRSGSESGLAEKHNLKDHSHSGGEEKDHNSGDDHHNTKDDHHKRGVFSGEEHHANSGNEHKDPEKYHTGEDEHHEEHHEDGALEANEHDHTTELASNFYEEMQANAAEFKKEEKDRKDDGVTLHDFMLVSFHEAGQEHY